MQVTFLGAGVFGQALADVAKSNRHKVKFYDPYKHPDIDLRSALSGSAAAVFVAPSAAAAELLPQLPQALPLICASKGFLSAEPFHSFDTFSALGGAAFASDFQQHTCATSEHIALTASSPLAAQIFATDWLDIQQVRDTRGIMLCGALKNLYAFGAGLLASEPVDLPAFAASPALYLPQHPYLQAVDREIRLILLANGAEPSTFDYACGLPDLAISCTHGSRNFRYGRHVAQELARHRHPRLQPHATVEGLNTIRSVATTPDFTLPVAARIASTIISQVSAIDEDNHYAA